MVDNTTGWMAQPIMQRCGRCGNDWWGSHMCPSLTGAIPLPATLPATVQINPAPPALTAEDVRRIVREELQRAANPVLSQGVPDHD